MGLQVKPKPRGAPWMGWKGATSPSHQTRLLHRMAHSFLMTKQSLENGGKSPRQMTGEMTSVPITMCSSTISLHTSTKIYVKTPPSPRRHAWFRDWASVSDKGLEWNNNLCSDQTEESFHQSLPTCQTSHMEFLLNPGTVFFSSELVLHVVIKTKKINAYFKILKDSKIAVVYLVISLLLSQFTP